MIRPILAGTALGISLLLPVRARAQQQQALLCYSVAPECGGGSTLCAVVTGVIETQVGPVHVTEFCYDIY